MPPDPLLRTPEHREAIAGSHRNVSAQFHLRLYVAGFGISPHPAFFVYAGFKVEGFLHKTLRRCRTYGKQSRRAHQDHPAVL